MAAPVLDVRHFSGAFAGADEALAWLVAEVAWEERMVARKTASFGVPYDYSGQRYEAREMPQVIAAMAARGAELAGHPFTNCLCNLYQGGKQTMGFHQDSYDSLVDGSWIAIVSLGATRTLRFRSLDQQHHEAFALEHGSILLMNETTQRGWKHAVVKEAGAGLRISATFRDMIAR